MPTLTKTECSATCVITNQYGFPRTVQYYVLMPSPQILCTYDMDVEFKYDKLNDVYLYVSTLPI